MAKHKHLTLNDRFTISNLLNKSSSFKSIGIEIDKDCTTVSKEVRNHLIFKKTGAVGKAYNACRNRFHCDNRLLCDDCKRTRHCWSCKQCNSVCPDFVKENCPKLKKAPYVCNGCSQLKSCTLEKCFYNAAQADTEYRETLTEVRQGISLSEEEVKHLDKLISPLIMKGQSLNHICANNQDSIMVSESTIYRLIEYNAFSACNIDLPRKVRYSKRSIKKHNSYSRKSLGNKCPYDMFAFLYGEEILSALGCHKIAPNDVTLNNSIFKEQKGNN